MPTSIHSQVQQVIRPDTLVADHYKNTLVYQDLEKISIKPSSIRTSGPQGKVEPFTVIEDPAYWYADQWKNSKEYLYFLTEEDIQEIDGALKVAEDSQLDIENITQDHFPLKRLGAKLIQFREEVRTGRGFQIIKGIPIDKYSTKELITLYWGFGIYWGKPASQNSRGHYLGHVKNIAEGTELDDPNTRVYRTSLAQPFHHDNCDLVGLFCLKNAIEGGQSSWTSSLTIHNELLKLGRKDLVQTLTEDFYVSRKGEIPEGKSHYYKLPIVNYHKGYFNFAYAATFYEVAQQFDDVPKFTEKQKEAIKYVNSLAQSDKLRMDYILQPGDIQLLCNHTILHNRQEFKDHPDIDKRRHLLRLWVGPENERPLPPQYEDHFGSLEIGNRGGIKVPGIKYNRVPLQAE